MNHVLALLLFVSMLQVGPDQRRRHLFLAGDSTMSIKETKAYPETGWGMPFVYFWDSTVQVVNRAKNGRSTKTFITEGLWKSIMNEAQPGDYVLIQFGHNDEVKSKVNTYTTPDEFTANLKRFVSETRNKQAIPVLLTPVARRKFDATGQLEDTHAAYSALVRQVAAEQQTAFIDLDALSQALYRQLGVEPSKLLFVHLAAGDHPNYPAGKEDNTHFSELGARLVAQLVLKQLIALEPALANSLVHPVKK